MADNSKIEWTDATWNPVTGCTKVSAGCDNCYAETFAERWRGTAGHPYEYGFDLTLRPERLDQPLRWTRPRRIFVNSMSDLFHDGIDDGYIADVFATMAMAQQHTFQVLTKRHGRMRALLSGDLYDLMVRRLVNGDGRLAQRLVWPLPNVWLGVSVEDQHWADIRIPALLATPATVRWISAEPLLGPVDLAGYLPRPADAPWFPIECRHGRDHCPICDRTVTSSDGLGWVVCGGESGPGARPMHPDWARSLRDQCVDAEVPFLFKQWGEWVPDGDNYSVANGRRLRYAHVFLRTDGTQATIGEPGGPGVCMDRVGKHAAGRHLYGQLHDGYPHGHEAVTT
jgi:protein gp37